MGQVWCLTTCGIYINKFLEWVWYLSAQFLSWLIICFHQLSPMIYLETFYNSIFSQTTGPNKTTRDRFFCIILYKIVLTDQKNKDESHYWHILRGNKSTLYMSLFYGWYTISILTANEVLLMGLTNTATRLVFPDV